MTNFDRIKNMTIDELAQRLVFDEEGFERSPCGVCFHYGNCQDDCYGGVKKWLESEAE